MTRSTFYLISGLPGSGKTTLANSLRAEYDKPHIYVNRDMVRNMLGYESPVDALADEFMVTKICDDLIERARHSCRDVWFDNINGQVPRIKRLHSDFFDVQVITVLASPKLCIARQQFRERKVPDEVIWTNYNKYEHFRSREAAEKLGIVFEESDPSDAHP